MADPAAETGYLRTGRTTINGTIGTVLIVASGKHRLLKAPDSTNLIRFH